MPTTLILPKKAKVSSIHKKETSKDISISKTID